MKETKKMIITIILLLSIICVTIGVSFAAFSFISHGTVENTIETGTVALTYTEGKTGIILEDALPISDETGKMLTGENNVFDFTVTATLGKDTVITYEVTAVKIPITDMEPLLDNEVRLYLERAVDPEIEYTEIMAPTNFIPKGEVSEIGSPLGSMILDSGTFSNEGVTIHNYRLRMWVDENTEIGETPKKYGIRINVYAKQGTIESSTTDESCFVIGEYAYDEFGMPIVEGPSIIGYDENCPKDVVIPSTINGEKVLSISAMAFSGKILTSVVIPDGILAIGTAAFLGNQLTTVTIPNSVTLIENAAFNSNQFSDEEAFIYKRNADGSIDYTTIISYAGKKRDNVIIPNSVTTIADWAFANNQLTNVIIPNSVTSIGVLAFSMNQLTSLTIGTSVETIGDNAFIKSNYSNSKLTKIINKTGKSFDWRSITHGSSAATFVTGTIPHSDGDIIVTDTE